MATNYVHFDFSEAKAFFEAMSNAASGDFETEIKRFIQGIGLEFLRILQDEIIRRKVVDSRLLLQSFQYGHEENVWIIREGGLELEVGTNISYAKYVNDGHWTNKKGQAGRFVPGYWNGDRFIYDPKADTGMYLKQKWIPGSHYWDQALRILDKMYPKLIEAKIDQWLNEYFKDFM